MLMLTNYRIRNFNNDKIRRITGKIYLKGYSNSEKMNGDNKCIALIIVNLK